MDFPLKISIQKFIVIMVMLVINLRIKNLGEKVIIVQISYLALQKKVRFQRKVFIILL